MAAREPETRRCQDCKGEYTTLHPRAKYCPVCRTYKNVLYLLQRLYDCWACGNQYAPLERNDKLCGRCSLTVKRRHDTKGTCRLCHEKSEQLLSPEVRICRPCATNPDNRQAFIRALAKKRQQRSATATG